MGLTTAQRCDSDRPRRRVAHRTFADLRVPVAVAKRCELPDVLARAAGAVWWAASRWREFFAARSAAAAVARVAASISRRRCGGHRRSRLARRILDLLALRADARVRGCVGDLHLPCSGDDRLANADRWPSPPPSPPAPRWSIYDCIQRGMGASSGSVSCATASWPESRSTPD